MMRLLLCSWIEPFERNAAAVVANNPASSKVCTIPQPSILLSARRLYPVHGKATSDVTCNVLGAGYRWHRDDQHQRTYGPGQHRKIVRH